MTLPEWFHRSLRIPYILSVERLGKKGSTIIFLHGLAGQKEVWDEPMHRLGHSHRCIAIDLLGHGQSAKPTHLRYDVATHLRSIRWTLFWRGVHGPKTIVGHSMGTIIAADWAYKYPKKISCLVLASVPIYNRATEAKGLRSRFEAMTDAAHLFFYRALRSLPRPLALVC
ncbi:MAG TPA: alpha/beta fold hydrolase [Patescibacteria group bacterium]|nr:alpha/beta fold hydrolase [Patescibacteria group bacterium]